MHEPDDRLAGDPIWELFPAFPISRPAPKARGFRRGLAWAAVVAILGGAWFLCPPVSVVGACLAIAVGDFRLGLRLAQWIEDGRGRGVGALFSCAWGATKIGMVAFLLMVVLAHVEGRDRPKQEVSGSFVAAPLLWFGGFLASAGLTALGLLQAFRAGMRIWIGVGVNKARFLLMVMLVVGYTSFVIGPLSIWASGKVPRSPAASLGEDLAFLFVFAGILLGGPVLILVVHDALSRHVVADRPGKFGPKVPAVGIWNS